MSSHFCTVQLRLVADGPLRFLAPENC